MKPVIIIAIAFVLLIPSNVFAYEGEPTCESGYELISGNTECTLIEPEIFRHTEATYKECMSRVNQQTNELLKQHALESGSIIGYEGKYQKQLIDNCIFSFLYPLTDAGLELVEQGKYHEA